MELNNANDWSEELAKQIKNLPDGGWNCRFQSDDIRTIKRVRQLKSTMYTIDVVHARPYIEMAKETAEENDDNLAVISVPYDDRKAAIRQIITLCKINLGAPVNHMEIINEVSNKFQTNSENYILVIQRKLWEDVS